jgi:hypothetical protein
MSNPSVHINEPVVRIVAFEVAVLAISFVFTHLLVIPLFLLFDFYLRGWELKRYSPLRLVAVQVNRYFFHDRQKPVFAAPKVFAARIGAIFSLAIIGLYVFESPLLSTGVAAVMICFALLESLAGFCAGCYLYSYYEKLRHHFHF